MGFFWQNLREVGRCSESSRIEGDDRLGSAVDIRARCCWKREARCCAEKRPPKFASSSRPLLRFNSLQLSSTTEFCVTMVPPTPPKDLPSSSGHFNLESVYDPTSIDPRFSAKTTTPPAPIRTRYDSEEDDDDDLIYTSIESRRDPSKKHTSTPSTAPLLPQDSATSSRTRMDGERRAEAESEIEETGYSNGRVPNDWISRTRAFFDRNNGEAMAL